MTTSSSDTDSSSGRQPQQAAPARARLAYDRTGRGEPLVLLHGQGFSRRCWDPIVDTLAAQRDVIAVDLPGHGDSPRQPKGTGSAPHDLAVAVAELLDELGLSTAHAAGNSSGGWVALELGRLQRARLGPRRIVAQVRAAAHPGGDAAGPAHRQDHAAGGAERPAHPAVPRTVADPGLRAPVQPALRAGQDRGPRHGRRSRLPRDIASTGEATVRGRGGDHGAGDGRVRLPRSGAATRGSPAAATSCPTGPAGSPCPAAGMSRCSTTPQPPPTCCCVPATPPPPARSANPSGRTALAACVPATPPRPAHSASPSGRTALAAWQSLGKAASRRRQMDDADADADVDGGVTVGRYELDQRSDQWDASGSSGSRRRSGPSVGVVQDPAGLGVVGQRDQPGNGHLRRHQVEQAGPSPVARRSAGIGVLPRGEPAADRVRTASCPAAVCSYGTSTRPRGDNSDEHH
jgi:pimeloyl-ACP methyl ester carboxylesterase